jgi:LysM repeat protein
MSNSVVGSAQLPASQPTALPAVAGGGTAVTGVQPLVAGDPAATDAALQPVQPSLVDAAIADAQGTSVSGGGAAVSADPSNGVPEWVQRWLPGASDGATQQQTPPGKDASAPQKGVQQGWAWIGCSPQQSPVQAPTPPAKGDETDPANCIPAPPAKGDEPSDVPPPPPMKGEEPSAPPSKGTPPTPPTPPTKTTKPTKVQHAATPARKYTVKPGDTLSKIAARFDTTWQKLFAANKGKISNPNLIYPGQVFTIPGTKATHVPKTPPTPPTKPPTKTPSGPPSKTPPPPPVQGPAPGKTPPPPPGKPPLGKGPTTPPPVTTTPAPSGTKPPKPPTTPPGTNPGNGATLPPAPPAPTGNDGFPPPLRR